MTNLLELRAANPTRFHPQVWYNDEPFIRTCANADHWSPPTLAVKCTDTDVTQAAKDGNLPLAVDLAIAFLRYPDDPTWSHYLWCRDKDRLGQRVYVGGVCAENGMRFEVHRHLAITDKWRIPMWL